MGGLGKRFFSSFVKLHRRRFLLPKPPIPTTSRRWLEGRSRPPAPGQMSNDDSKAAFGWRQKLKGESFQGQEDGKSEGRNGNKDLHILVFGWRKVKIEEISEHHTQPLLTLPSSSPPPTMMVTTD
ncbi:hypothetical protein Ancab_018490 [Ancistrocladus abbreviatus]